VGLQFRKKKTDNDNESTKPAKATKKAEAPRSPASYASPVLFG
jgi:hypothetical protein